MNPPNINEREPTEMGIFICTDNQMSGSLGIRKGRGAFHWAWQTPATFVWRSVWQSV